MIKYKNEQGAALILTMFIITLLLLFVSIQLFQVTNTRKQVSTMEKSIMAEHMAEMGIDYYRAVVKNVEQDSIESVDEYVRQIKALSNETLNKRITTSKEKGNRSYQVDVNQIESNSDEVVIDFSSLGQAYDRNKKIESTITISIIEN